MRTVVVVILLLAPLVLGQAQSNPEDGIVEFYTTPSRIPQALVIYSGDQRLGEVTINQLLRFSGAPGNYSFGLTPDARPAERITLTLRSGQHLYLRVNSEGFYLGRADEVVRPVLNSNASVANAGNTAKPDGSASKQNATIFFYRDRQGPDQQVTVYSLFVAGSRPIATLQKGEYFAISASPGMTAFSWVPAPARGQTVMMDIGSGQQIFLKVQPSGITPIAGDTVRTIQDLQTVASTRVFDRGRVIDEAGKLIQAAAESAALEKAANRRPLVDVESPETVDQAAADQQRPTNSSRTQEIKIRGYVTAVTSRKAFDIDAYRVMRDENLTVQFENPGRDVEFNIDDVQVGTELDIKGEFDSETRELWAKNIKVDLQQFRKLKNTAVLAEPPVGLVRAGNGWTGTLVADGQHIRVSPQTKVSFKTGDQPQKVPGSEEIDDGTVAVDSFQYITAGMLMTYEGVRDTASGIILADRVEFARNEFEKGEQDLWTRSMVRFKSADFLTKPGERSELGELTVPDVGKFKLVPNEQVQEYVSKVGKSLIPKYAISIAQTDPSRFRFQFYVVVNNEPNAFTLPNGVFVIYSGLFGILENEAQLAAVIGHEMAHVLQEHQWRDMHDRKILTTASGFSVGEAFGRRTLRDVESLTAAAMRNGYTPEQENQADRVGLEYMVNAGYDPREAPKVWTAIAKATGFKGKNSFYNTFDNHAPRRSYLVNQIKSNYSELNFANLRIEGINFRRMTNLANEAATGKIQTVLQGER
jgi:Peptidase family M48